MALKVDLYKRIVFEYHGVDGSMIPSRCREITLDKLGDYAAAKFRFYDLSEWVVFHDGVVVGDRSYRSVADANYAAVQIKGACVRRVVDVLELL